MKNILNYITKTFHLSSEKKENVICNYSNNYYGDQYCQPAVKGNN